MSLPRYADWEQRLQDFVLSYREMPFSYDAQKGVDCCRFVADAVRSFTGVDLAESFRGRYSSRKEARAFLQARYQTSSLEVVLAKVMQEKFLTEVPVLCAQRGDIVLVDRSEGVSLGMIALSGNEIWAAAERGFLRLPLSLARRAWRV